VQCSSLEFRPVGSYRHRWIALGALGVCAGAAADLDGDLADLGARVSYGFYAEEPAVVAAAAAALDDLPETDVRIAYLRGLAALRLAQLRAMGASARAEIDRCLDFAATAAKLEPTSAEPWVLAAACEAYRAGDDLLRGRLHGRRFDQAVDHIRRLDADNPRLALIIARRESDGVAATEDQHGQPASALESTLGRYASDGAARLGADWGEPEALLLLGQRYLMHGDMRAARDMVEHALLLAPGYRDALRLQQRLFTEAP
jgi:hypothetical protein